MVDKSADDIADDAESDISSMGWVDFIRNWGVGGIFAAVVLVVIEFIVGVGEAVSRVVRDFREAFSRLFDSTFFSAADIMDAAGETSAGSFLDGGASALGPFAWPAGVFVALSGIYVAWYWYQRIDFNPWSWISDKNPWG